MTRERFSRSLDGHPVAGGSCLLTGAHGRGQPGHRATHTSPGTYPEQQHQEEDNALAFMKIIR
jgi:hypothetical protein